MNKIQNPPLILLIGLFIFSTSYSSQAQDSLKMPLVTSNMEDYHRQVASTPGKEMIEPGTIIPDLVFDIRYASLNNFMHRYMYAKGSYRCFLRRDAAMSLKKVQDLLHEMSYSLKIFDAYRPYSVTVKFWELIKDERYVANPAKGSGHNRGVAVDLTIIESATGKELDMGTGFDNFTDTAHHDFKDLPESILKNRNLLRQTMEQAGFKALETEWWHYSLPAAANYELLDLPFKKLRKRL